MGDASYEYVGYNAVSVDDYCYGAGLNAEQILTEFIGIVSDDHISVAPLGVSRIVLYEAFYIELGGPLYVYGHYRNVVLVALCHVVEVRKLLKAGAAGGIPEVKHYCLASHSVKVKALVASDYIKISYLGTGVTYVCSDGCLNLTRLVCYGGSFGLLCAAVDEVIIYQRTCEKRGHKHSCGYLDDIVSSLYVLLGKLLFLVSGAIYCIGREEELGALPAYSARGTYVDTLSAVDTLNVTDAADIHLTFADTKSAIGTALLIELNSYESYPVKEAVEQAERAEEAAEEAENKYAGHEEGYHKKELPGEERAEHTQIAFVYAV